MRNKTFTIFSSIGIILILLGHLNYGILEFGGLFPYYSYHVLLFVFVSGYFYKQTDEEKILGYIGRKAKKLLLPYMIINLIFALIIMGLRQIGFVYGGEFTVRNLLWEPLYTGHQFMLNAPGWFIPVLFMLEVCNVLFRWILKRIKADNEYLIMAVYLVLGVACIWLSKRGMVYDYYRIPARIMFMLPAFQLGRMYRAKLEQYDKLNSIVYFVILFVINAALCYTQAGLAYSAAWVGSFANNPLIPYITTFTGIALWLRVSKLLAKLADRMGLKLRFIEYMGSHTFDICLWHLSAFLLVNAILCGCGVNGFDMELFRGDVYYAYDSGVVGFKMIYLVAGIVLPLVICLAKDQIKKLFRKFWVKE